MCRPNGSHETESPRRRAAELASSQNSPGVESIIDEEESDAEEEEVNPEDLICGECDSSNSEDEEDEEGDGPAWGDSDSARECDCAEQGEEGASQVQAQEVEESIDESLARREDGFCGCSLKSQDSSGIQVWLEALPGGLLCALCDHTKVRKAHVKVTVNGESVVTVVDPGSARLVLWSTPVAAADMRARLRMAQETFTWSFGWGDPSAVHNDKVLRPLREAQTATF
jgi:hypothetical protein